MSTRNTNIAPSKLGRARLPFEHSTVGNGYASSGPVKTYKMSQEEILRRYGPIKGPRKTDGTLYNYKPREVKEMSRLDKIMETMTKDQYIALKQQGKTDMEIMQEVLGHDNWGDVFAIAKKKWGVVGMFPGTAQKKRDAPEKDKLNENAQNENDNPDLENEPDELINGDQEPDKQTDVDEGTTFVCSLTINDAIKLRDKLTAEVNCIDGLLDYQSVVSLAEGIRLLLDGHRCLCAQQLKMIQDAFETMTVVV